MTFRERAENAAKEVFETLQASPSDEQTERVLNIIEKATIEAVLETQRGHRDRVHKVGENLRQSEQVLIANLSALR